MEPWQSWTAAVVIGGGLAYYYSGGFNTVNKNIRSVSDSFEEPHTSGSRRRQGKQTAKNALETVSHVSERAKGLGGLATSAADAASSALESISKTSKKRKGGKDSSAITPAANATPVQANPIAEDEEENGQDDLKDWATQLDARKKGISLSATASTSKANGRQQHAAQKTDTASGANGISNSRAKGGVDVSDMLEPRAPSPSVMRIVGEDKPKKQAASKAVQESLETKKQRQNKRKVEEQRLAREEQERQRQTLLENQRRTAREARGEPAKNVMASASQPSSNVWTSQASTAVNGNHAHEQATTNGSTATNNVQLLDTFEPDTASNSSSNGAHTNVTTPATVASSIGQDLPPEEVQLEMIQEMDGWNEVAKGRKSKKKAPAQGSDGTPSESGKDSGEAMNGARMNGQKVSAPMPSAPKAKQLPIMNGFAALEQPAGKGHPDDSDWL